ncbi:MAG: hypothetical protein IT290_06430 [Deltaproteobacteria bacterium]|nr:hypothetical protein [Deltaproteobacteria bacterium]
MPKEIPIENTSKRKTFEEWLKDDHVLVHIDARHAGVIVPTHLAGNPTLSLKLSRLFQGTTDCDELGITTHLKFSGDYFQCVLPWEAVWGMTSERSQQQIWPRSAPEEILRAVAGAKLKEIGSKLLSTISGKRGSKDGTPQEHPTPEITKISDKKRSHLKRIK